MTFVGRSAGVPVPEGRRARIAKRRVQARHWDGPVVRPQVIPYRRLLGDLLWRHRLLPDAGETTP